MAKYCQYLFFLLLNSLFSTICPALQHSHAHDQTLLLLDFKESLLISENRSDYHCFESSFPKTKTWNKSTNCCTWEGITCDKVTGHVIEIDLSCSQLMGTIDSNNSLFRLSHLQRLNLAFNDIETSQLSKIFGNFTHLTHLNLSNNVFAGDVPSEILKLTDLTSLDLSYNQFTLGPDIFKLLLTNLTKLSKVYLTNLNIFSSIPKNLSASLENVNLRNTTLRGEVPETTFHLPKLKKIVLRFNPQLYGLLPSVRWNSSTTLEWLDLSLTSFQQEIPDSIGNLRVLKYLDLSSCKFNGSLPTGMFINMTQIETIDLSSNRFIGSLPSFRKGVLSLTTLDLSYNSFTGTIPSEIFSLSSLRGLKLDNNQLYGLVPMELSSLVNLGSLDLSSNNFSGLVELDIFSNMKQLFHLSLSHNKLSLITKNNSILPKSIEVLQLASCNITDLKFLSSPPKYFLVDLSMNSIQKVPSWLWSKWKNIVFLNVSYNSITHKERIRFEQILSLDIRSNLFQGPFPQVPASIITLLIASNQLLGMIPPSVICNLSSISMVDFSNNNFTGSIPHCVGNMSQVSVLDLRMNKFEGTIPNTFSMPQLVTLNLHGNNFRGSIPSSLAKCTKLKVLDLGNNNLNDTFPSWLGLLPELRVLSLRHNNFHGKINFSPTATSFSKLQILDLSHNQFLGTVPPMLFKSFTGMMETDGTSEPRNYIGYMSYYKDSTIVVSKGIQVRLVRILTTWTTIDLSSNNFEGNISSSIGSLISLRQLNLSNNGFRGEIPTSFGNLSLLESLDLSSNQLFGTIPTELTTLHFLSKLNLSQNHLTGRIPGGTQFQNFENDSYIGNYGLCGIPLSKSCIGDKVSSPGLSEVPEQDVSGFIDGFSWRSVVIGYGVGIVVGLGIGALMNFTRKPECLVKFVEEEGYRIVMKRNRKKKVSRVHCKK